MTKAETGKSKVLRLGMLRAVLITDESLDRIAHLLMKVRAILIGDAAEYRPNFSSFSLHLIPTRLQKTIL